MKAINVAILVICVLATAQAINLQAALVESQAIVMNSWDDLMYLFSHPTLNNAIAYFANFAWYELSPFIAGYLKCLVHQKWNQYSASDQATATSQGITEQSLYTDALGQAYSLYKKYVGNY